MSTGYDPISNLMAAIKNSLLVGRPTLSANHSRYREEVLKALAQSGFLTFKIYKEKGRKVSKLQIEISDQPEQQRRLLSFRAFSRPGRRFYQPLSQLRFLLSKRREGVFISTSRGVLSIREAVKRGLGGEVLFEV